MGWNNPTSAYLLVCFTYEVERLNFDTLFNFFYAYKVESKGSTISSGVWDEIKLPKSREKWVKNENVTDFWLGFL